jgi:undecaprenyl-diphosphatase
MSERQVLLLVSTAAVGFLLLERHYGLVWLTLLATTGGALLSFLLKRLIHRDRPTVVPHLREVSTLSFPSGHALLSAVEVIPLQPPLHYRVRPGALRVIVPSGEQA